MLEYEHSPENGLVRKFRSNSRKEKQNKWSYG